MYYSGTIEAPAAFPNRESIESSKLINSILDIVLISPHLKSVLTTFQNITYLLVYYWILKGTTYIRKPFVNILCDDYLLGIGVNNKICIVSDYNNLPISLNFFENIHQFVNNKAVIQIILWLIKNN